MSEIIVKALEEYFNIHRPGNPQTPLPQTLTPGNHYLAEALTKRLQAALKNPDPANVFWLENMHSLLSRAQKIPQPPEKLKKLVVEAERIIKGAP